MANAIITMKKWFLLALAMLSIAFEGLQAQTTGSCGTGLTWTFQPESGSLYISGNGAMNDRVSSWNDIRSAVTSVTMDSGIKVVGIGAFNNFVNLASVSLPL